MTKEIKEIGHNVQLKGIVIHQVSKIAGITSCNIKFATTELPKSSKEKKFIGSIDKAYYKKSNPNYGIFGVEEPLFKTELSNYIKGEIDFLNFTKKSVEQYKKEISRSAPATGGLIVFAHYLKTDKSEDYLLVLTTNNKDGYAINEADLTINGIKNLDLSKIDVACLINITKWQIIERNIDTESKTYLSFVRGNKEVSLYFMKFIDCQDKTTSTESTRRLITAIDDYCNKQGFTRDSKIKKKNEIFDYCNDCRKNGKEISLITISAIFDPENADVFKEFASDEDYGVSEIISGDSKQLRRIKFYKYKGDGITIEFDSDLYNKKVFYDKDKKQLTFKNLSSQLIAELEK